MPTWNEYMERRLEITERDLSYHLWIGDEEKHTPPQHFNLFMAKFLSIPQNCGFARKGNRYYYCVREGDFWDMELDSHTYWMIVIDYCWTVYIEWWIEKDSNTENKFVTYIRTKLEEMDNPLSKRYLYKLFGEQNYYINARLKDNLIDAYQSRNKSKSYI